MNETDDDDFDYDDENDAPFKNRPMEDDDDVGEDE